MNLIPGRALGPRTTALIWTTTDRVASMVSQWRQRDRAGPAVLNCGRAPGSATDVVRRRRVESRPAEYKQVTILFADVVRSMDIAARVGPERLREIMADLVNTFGGCYRAQRRNAEQLYG